MAQIDNIVQVYITRQTTQIDIEAFDIPLLMVEMTDSDAGFTDRVRTYTSLEGVSDDLGTQHAGYKMAVQLLSGEVRPATFKIGKVNKQSGTPETYVQALQAIIDVDNTWYAVSTQSHLDADINSIASTIQAMRKTYFTSTSSQLALSQAQTVVYTAQVQFNLTGAATGDTASVIIAGERYQTTRGASTWGNFTYVGSGTGSFAGVFSLAPTTGILSITNSNVAYTVTSAKQEIAAGYTGPIAAENISLTDPVGMDIGQRLRAKGMDRTAVMFSNTADSEWPELSWVGSQLVEVPGSNTWEYKELAGVTVSTLTDSQISLLESRGYNYYIKVKGANITRRGQVADREWIDVIILVDWIYARIQEQVFFRFINTKKIPFTDAGATMIENEIRSVLAQATVNGGIDGYTVRSPRVLSIPEVQRNARVMGDFTFDARLAGAVSVAIIRGVVHA